MAIVNMPPVFGRGGGMFASGTTTAHSPSFNPNSNGWRIIVTGLKFRPRLVIALNLDTLGFGSGYSFATDDDGELLCYCFATAAGSGANSAFAVSPIPASGITTFTQDDNYVTEDGFSIGGHSQFSRMAYYFCCG